MYDVFYSFNILNTSFNIGFCITVKRLEQSWFVRYINVYYYYYYYYYYYIKTVTCPKAGYFTTIRSGIPAMHVNSRRYRDMNLKR